MDTKKDKDLDAIYSERINTIYNIFKDYYGENRVDFKESADLVKFTQDVVEGPISDSFKYAIIVHFPEVKVSNERDSSIIIKDFYALIKLNFKGFNTDIRFIKATYSEEQWKARYIHSHVHSLNYSYYSRFSSCCLGTGPIKNTFRYLRENYDEDRWRLFVWELDKYVHVESLKGVPYMYLERVGIDKSYNNRESINYQNYCMSINIIGYQQYMKDFLKYLIKNNIFKFCYCNGNYKIANNSVRTALEITRVFIEWVNNNDYPSHTNKDFVGKKITEYNIVNDTLYRINSDDTNSITNYIDKYLFTFKNNKVILRSDKQLKSTPTRYKLLNIGIIGYICYKIERFVNCYYGKSVAPNSETIIL